MIIPCFHPEPSDLKRAVSSLLGQRKFQDELEIVIVDDGGGLPELGDLAGVVSSASFSVSLAVERHPENLGLAAARNTGMRRATGDWIILLDADDWLLPDAFSSLMAVIRQGTPDLVYLPTVLANSEKGATVFPETEIALTKELALGDGPFSCKNLPELALAMSSWSLSLNREFVQRNALHFDQVLRRWEDRPFLLDCLSRAQRVAAVLQPSRVYFVGKGAGARITNRTLTRRDLWLMARHIRLVARQLDQSGAELHPVYRATHRWLSVEKFLAVMLVAHFPNFWNDRAGRRIVIGTARRISEELEKDKYFLPLPSARMGNMPASLRFLVRQLLKNSNRPSAYLMLYAIAAAFVVRRTVR